MGEVGGWGYSKIEFIFLSAAVRNLRQLLEICLVGFEASSTLGSGPRSGSAFYATVSLTYLD